VIAGVSDKLRATLETGEVYNAISQTVADAFHSRTFGVLGYQPKTNEYFVLFNQGFSIGEQTRFPGNRVLQERFVEQSQPMVVEELKREADHQYQETLEMLVGFKVAVLVPLNIRDETLGLLVLGPKETRDMYNDEDLKTLGVIASQAAIAIKNAQLYEETKKFSQTLQKEVERQTAELQKAYADLKVLDKAKTEFISMASHQLRTPLSSIKGYISMLLEGSYGKIGGRARGKLENVFESNERLIRIVNDLLDISRIELGKMELEKAPAQMEDLIQSCCEEMKINAEKKGLEFTFKKPEKPLPKIAIDSLKIRQVILNLIDNAIRYTQEGKIEIGIKKTDSGIQLSVEDTGEGLTPKEQKDIFEGFTRGSAGLAHFIEGAGLGLYTAKKFLQLHRGKIWVESRGKGKGSTFFVELPVK
jgi:signal transduction histidine kinase